jgi:hypothetical protein
MNQPRIKYDEISDTLTITFVSGVLATGIELSDHILLRVNLDECQPISLVFFDYSVLAQTTEMGGRSFPLTGLLDLSRELQEVVVEILQNKPISNFLHLSTYTPSLIETIPIVFLQPISAVIGVV